MIYFLILLLCCELGFIYLTNGKRIASPSFLGCAMFTFSSIVYALVMNDMYGKDISLQTAIIIVALLFCLYLGEQMSNMVTVTVGKSSFEKRNRPITNRNPYVLSNTNIVILTAIVFVACLVYFVDVYKFSIRIGNTSGSIWLMSEYVRHAANYGTGKVLYSPSTIVSQLTIIAEILIYFCVYVYMTNLVSYGERKLKVLIPCLGYILYVVACDSRSYLIRNITIIAIIVFSVLSSVKSSSRTVNRKIMKFGLIAIVGFIVVFRVLGYRTGTSENYTFVDNIAKYVSSSVYGLNEYIEGGRSGNRLFGQGVFRLIYAKLNDFGCSFEIGSPHGEFYVYKSGQSNIYTGLKTPIEDFTVFGAGIFLMIWGAWANSAIKSVRKNGPSLLRCAGAGLLFFPIIMLSIGSQWGNTLSITTLYMLFYLFLLTKVIERKERR